MNRIIRLTAPLLLALISGWVSSAAQAAWLRDLPATLVQPDGRVLDCLITGDEYFRWAHDANGFVILQRPEDGRYVYAQVEEGRWLPSSFVVGEVDPTSVGLTPYPAIPAGEHQRRVEFFQNRRMKLHGQPLRAPSSGLINNLVVFVRFSDQTEFGEALSHYEVMFNSQASGANSVSRYYQEVSYNQLDILSSFFPQTASMVISYQDSHPRGYFQRWSATNPLGYTDDNQGAARLHAMLQASVISIASQVPTDLNIDNNHDGYVDNVCFVARGTADDWNDMLWPHNWDLLPQYQCSINDKTVRTYDFQLQDLLNLPSVGVGVLCHEMFHSLGAPDLYRYEEGHNTFIPVGKWDLMENTTNPPQHTLSFMKFFYGRWISSIPTITTSGTYTLQPLTSSSNNCYRINSPNSTTQYFIVEYRRAASSSFEAGLPGSGLIVTRINAAADTVYGNAYGPPDLVYVYRPQGTNTSTGRIDDAYFSVSSGRTAITDQTSPSGFLADGSAGGLNITNIGSAESTISFYVTVAGGTPTCQSQAGDANGDNNVNVFDLVAVVNHILGTTPLSGSGLVCADMNDDATINILDLVAIVNRILNLGAPLPGPELLSERTAPLIVDYQVFPDRLELAWSGSSLAGFQASLPLGEGISLLGGPRLSGARSSTTMNWGLEREVLHCLLYNPGGGDLAAGELLLEVPWTGPIPTDRGEWELHLEDLVVADLGGRELPVGIRRAAGEGQIPRNGLRVVGIEPNPSFGENRILLAGSNAPGSSPVSIFDASGRLVRTLAVQAADPSVEIILRWDGRDSGGEAVPSGVYFLRLPASGEKAGKLLIVR